jgi:hypothetical protein
VHITPFHGIAVTLSDTSVAPKLTTDPTKDLIGFGGLKCQKFTQKFESTGAEVEWGQSIKI